MDIKCCKCKKEYDLAINIFEYKKDTNCPILICPYCGFKHVINFMPFEKRIKVKKINKLDLAFTVVILGASRIANASRVDQSKADNTKVGPWNIPTLSLKDTFDISATINPDILCFKPDGLKMYVAAGPSGIVKQYSLTTAWDVTTIVYDDKYKSITEDTYPQGLCFNSDGTKVVILGYITDTIYQYNLSIAWDISTMGSVISQISVGARESLPTGLAFNSDGTKMYFSGNDTPKTVYQYNLSTAWNLGTATFSDDVDISETSGAVREIKIKTDGKYLYVLTDPARVIYQYNLSTAWDISTASYYLTSSEIGPSYPHGFFISPDGGHLYIAGSSQIVYEYLMPNWNKNNDFILATRIYTSKGPIARAYKLLWRNVTDEGVFADVGATGEISYAATTDLTDDGALLLAEKICDVQTNYTWQNGLESEGDNLSPNTGTYSVADEYYTEFQWSLDCSAALDEHEYEFQLWDVTEGAAVGTCLASITMATAVVEGFKWNTKTILKWCGKVISKWNDLE